MTPDQLAAYKSEATRATMLSVQDVGTTERTLAFGYTCDRDTWHAYVHGGEIHVLVYPYRGDPLQHLHGDALPAEVLRPNKRVYPDTVDDGFARLMREAGEELTFLGNFDFTTPDAVRRQGMGAFKGKTHLNF